VSSALHAQDLGQDEDDWMLEMKRMLPILLLIASPVARAGGDAAEQHALDVCLALAKEQQIGSAERCYQTAYESADRRMNRAYEGLQRVLDEPTMLKLREAQRRWLGFREADRVARVAVFGSGHYPGALEPASTATSDYEVVRVRANQLEGWLQEL